MQVQVGSGGNTIEIAETGEHTIKIAMRESNSRIDGFFITKTEFVPTDKDVPANVTSINPRTGCPEALWSAMPPSIGKIIAAGYNATKTFTLTNYSTVDDTGGRPATVSSNVGWAVVYTTSIPPLKSEGDHEIRIDFNTDSLALGTHQAELTITGSAGNSPLRIPITLLVKAVPATAACGEIPLYAQDLVSPAIMVQLDTSGSMLIRMPIDDYGNLMSRIDIAEDVLKEVFLDRSINWGFATWAGGRCRPTDGNDAPRYFTRYRIGCANISDPGFNLDAHQVELQDRADDGVASGCTPFAPTMRGGLAYFKGNRVCEFYGVPFSYIKCQPRILVIISDGIGNTGTNYETIYAVVRDLIAEGITVVMVGFALRADRAIQLQWVVDKMKIAGEKYDDDFLFHLHNEDSSGNAVPFMAQSRQEFIAAMHDIVSNVKAQVFRGSTPAPTTFKDEDILLTASFYASDWSGELTARKFDRRTGELETYPPGHLREGRPKIAWKASEKMPLSPNAFIYDATQPSRVSLYTDDTLDNDNFICKPLGSIINSTPVVIGRPPFFYDFDNYFSFKYDQHVMNRVPMVYVGANDGALHAFRLSDGVEKWRFYPNTVKAKLNMAGTRPQDNMCSPAYCHQFILDGSPRPADIFLPGYNNWRTILTTGLGKGGSSFFALDVTYGKDFDEPPKPDGTEVKSRFLWEFTYNDDIELGLATSRPATVRLAGNDRGTSDTSDDTPPVWATFFGSGSSENPVNQADKEAYLFAVNSWDKSSIWKNEPTSPATDTYKIKLSSTELKNDVPASPLLVDYNDDDKMDRVYLGNMYGNMYRVKNINFGNTPVVEMLFDAEKTGHTTPVTARAGYAHAGDDDIWIYFGTGKYQDQYDKASVHQQYFLGLFDENASRPAPYKKADLVKATAKIIEAAHALDKDGNQVDINQDGTVDIYDLRRYRTITCEFPDSGGNCNPDNKSWLLELAKPVNSGSERVITTPLVVGGIVFFATFIPDGDVCGGGGETWLFAVDWRTGHFVTDAVFDINQDGAFDDSDKEVQEGGENRRVAGIFIGGGRPSQEIALHGDILFVGTTGDETGIQPPGIRVNIPLKRTKLRAWSQPALLVTP